MSHVKFLILFFILVHHALPLIAETSALDLEIQKERIRKVHGDFVYKLSGDWRASFDGKTEIWKWSDKGWKCGTSEAPSICQDWVPMIFQILNKSFWSQWSLLTHLDYEVSKARSEVERPVVAEQSGTDEQNAGDPEASQVTHQWAHNLIAERWTAKNTQDQNILLLLSAKDSRIESLEKDGQREAYEWVVASGRKTLEISRITLDRANQRVVLSRVK